MTWNKEMKVRATATLVVYGVADDDVDRVYRVLDAAFTGQNRTHIQVTETARELDDGTVAS
jgi:hypothetical protein